MTHRLFTFLIIVLFSSKIQAQGLLSEKINFTKQDTLRGSITPERVWWDVTYYHLDVKVEPEKKFISGKNTVQYKVLENHSVMQIDLQPPMVITKIVQNDKTLPITSNGNAHFITLVDKQNIGEINSLDIHFKGHPKEAINAPWDGGFSWKKDINDKHFVATSNQGLGASVWWPNKDHMYDEVDSMLISVNVPKELINVSNGRLRSVEQFGDTKTYHWVVKSPINNYGVNINIGDYVNFSETYDGENGLLDMDYYVLRDNLEKAKEHFKDAPKMMKAFEHWFGPYPFYKDSFKLVEVPYLGMEHQSSVTYGNKYLKGYLGQDRSNTGWGLMFDYIIIHEAGHEWFANNITVKDVADLWIHEGFTCYSESLFLDFYYGKKASSEYVIGLRRGIRNQEPLIGPYHVNKEGSSDMYDKGANLLHTLRQLIDNDEKWRHILRGLNKTFYHQTVTTEQVENYISEQSGIDLSAFFNQYLRTTKIPTLEYTLDNRQLKYRWTHVVEGFDMPIVINIENKSQWISPTTDWNILVLDTLNPFIHLDPNFYVYGKKL